MPNELSETLHRAMNAPATALVVCDLIIIEHASLAEPLWFCTNGEDIEVDGDLYTAIAAEVTLPDDTEDGVPVATIVLDNTDQKFTPLLRSASGEITVTLKEARVLNAAASPPTFQVELSLLPFTLSDVDMDAASARLNLTYDNGLNSDFPADDFNPTDYPGMF